MEIFNIKNLSFSYSGTDKKVLDDISLSINQGEFITLCGKSGCGKTTLLRLLKSSLSPCGIISGDVLFKGHNIKSMKESEEASQIGFVMQSPDNQIVTDKVWHELSFGLESLGFANSEIRTKVSEIASFFGMENWFHKDVSKLSGGQKQLLNVASVMVMDPDVIILDEPTSQLDPIAAHEFLNSLKKINNELGTTIIIVEHRLEDTIPLSGRTVVMDEGKIIADGTGGEVARMLKEINHDMYYAMPVPSRVFGQVSGVGDYPVNVREGRVWLENYVTDNSFDTSVIKDDKEINIEKQTAIQLKDVYFRYEKKSDDIIKGANISIKNGEVFGIVGGNGSGKTTVLSIMSGLNKPYSGNVLIFGNKNECVDKKVSMLVQNPQSVFSKKTVYLELEEMYEDTMLTDEQKQEKIYEIASLCCIEKVLHRHPYDLSGGEQQRTALAKILLTNPDILLLDEPTKGMDAHFKMEFSEIVADLKEQGITVVIVSHDIEFCAENCDRCALIFDGIFTSCDTPKKFFSGNSFYTTSANRMSRSKIPGAVTVNDIISALGGKIPDKKNRHICHKDKPKYEKSEKKVDIIQQSKQKKKLGKNTLLAFLFLLITVPVTIFSGMYFFDDRKYYFISLIIILETFIPFFMLFENKKPKARELVIISCLCALGVVSRSLFVALPQFKPVMAIVIVSGVCFGAQSGFLVGSVTAFVSNFFFGQGPWTPWQMFAFGIIGFAAGILLKKGLGFRTKLSLCIFGFMSVLIIYGGIMNMSSVLQTQTVITKEIVIAAYASGLPFDVIHGLSTAFFLWFISQPMIEKLERIKIKYGIIAT